MSDYVHKKVVRLPFPTDLIEKYGRDGDYPDEMDLKDLLGEYWYSRDKNGFDIECTDKNFYIDWVYYRTYGEESGDWGNVRLLTDNEWDTIKPYFDKLGVEYGYGDLRVVDYCYYNCCELPDYYELTTSANDDSKLFIS